MTLNNILPPKLMEEIVQIAGGMMADVRSAIPTEVTATRSVQERTFTIIVREILERGVLSTQDRRYIEVHREA